MYGAGGQKRVPDQFIKDFKALLPPLGQQQKIAAFLDRKTAEIDTLIAKKRRLLDRLAEKRTALITRAVTKGLDPDAPMKDSGIEWLGEIPAHWPMYKLQHLCRMKSGHSITSEDIHEFGDYPVYGGNGIRGYTDNYSYEGDYVLIGRQGALCGNIKIASGKFLPSEHALVVHPIKRFNPEWLAFVLDVMNLGQYSVSTAQPGLSVDNLGRLKVPVPPVTEQTLIVKKINQITKPLERVTELVLSAIDRLEEYRSALITNAVTGQIKVA